MIRYGKDIAYAESRLSHTLVKSEGGDPVYVIGYYKNKKFSCETSKGNMVYLTEQQMDYTPFNLGYINGSTNCCYTFRYPSRHYKQGLNTKNYSAPGRYRTGNFYKMLANLYPNPIQSFEEIALGEAENRGVSLSFAIESSIEEGPKKQNLFYMGQYVGKLKINLDNGLVLPEFNEGLSFLSESFEEELQSVK